MMKFIGELEVDAERGVIYFHDTEHGGLTLLRIQGLPTPIPKPEIGKIVDVRVQVREPEFPTDYEHGVGNCQFHANWRWTKRTG